MLDSTSRPRAWRNAGLIEKSIVLPDGRTMAYREFGDPTGTPLVNCHGGLICGLDIGPASSVAEELGIRIISPDRPGVGNSSPQPGRSTGQWAQDASALLNELGIEQFSTIGWSLGGLYAATLAAVDPERVTALVMVASTLPVEDPARFSELTRVDQLMIRCSERTPRTARAMFWAIGRSANRLPTRFTQLSVRSLSPADQTALASLPAGEFARWTAHAMRDPSGMVQEYRSWAEAWSCSLTNITCPTEIWHGTADTLVKPHWSAVLHAAIPHSVLHLIDGAGHLVAFERWHQVLSPLHRSVK